MLRRSGGAEPVQRRERPLVRLLSQVLRVVAGRRDNGTSIRRRAGSRRRSVRARRRRRAGPASRSVVRWSMAKSVCRGNQTVGRVDRHIVDTSSGTRSVGIVRDAGADLRGGRQRGASRRTSAARRASGRLPCVPRPRASAVASLTRRFGCARRCTRRLRQSGDDRSRPDASRPGRMATSCAGRGAVSLSLSRACDRWCSAISTAYRRTSPVMSVRRLWRSRSDCCTPRGARIGRSGCCRSSERCLLTTVLSTVLDTVER